MEGDVVIRIKNAISAGMSARLGIMNPNLKQIFITNIEKSEEIAFSMQLIFYATRIEKHFDWKAINITCRTSNNIAIADVI